MRKIERTALMLVACLTAGALVSLAAIPSAAASGTYHYYISHHYSYTRYNNGDKIVTWDCWGEIHFWVDMDTGEIVKKQVGIGMNVTNEFGCPVSVHEVCGEVGDGRPEKEATPFLYPGEHKMIYDGWYIDPDHHGTLRWGSYGGTIYCGLGSASFGGFVHDWSY